ncbi:MAG: tryptophan synthase subunit alpha, partial [Alphaproteobacteria bacterium]|nr:tryptophan synthase subunit alpha [Alphaproteobacteria bacterium]
PVVLMGYANPVYQYGFQDFCADAADAGVDGLIIVDLPPEEDDALLVLSQSYGLHLIKLVTPTTTVERLKTILPKASGFLYYVSVTGITGGASADINAVENRIAMIREHTDLPIAAGFGIRTPADVAAFARVADAVVVGSAIVDKTADPKAASAFVGSLAAAIKGVARKPS